VKSSAMPTSSIIWVAIKRMSVRIEDDKAIDVKTRMASEIRARGTPSLEDSRGAESSTSTESFLGSVGDGLGLGGACADCSCADEYSAILKLSAVSVKGESLGMRSRENLLPDIKESCVAAW